MREDLEPFVFQWHLDDACNLQCRHCYREAPRSAMTNLERRALLAEMVEFLKALGRRGRIHFAGGEPFACEDFLPMARLCSEEGLAFRILSNGTLITEDAARELVELHCLGIQVSIEGPQEIHDEIRGCGSFIRAMEGVRVARGAGLQVTLAMTLHQGNLAHLETVGELAAQHADRAYFSRMVPLGCGKNLGELTALQWEKAMERVLFVQSTGKVPVALRDPTFKPRLVSPWRAWRYKGHGGCDAGRSTLCIESDGTLMPCRRLGISLGRVQDSSLQQIWNTHPLLESLRSRHDLKGACGRCAYRQVCGGCRAFSMALSGELKGQDPMCPWAAPQKRVRVFMRHLESCLFSG